MFNPSLVCFSFLAAAPSYDATAIRSRMIATKRFPLTDSVELTPGDYFYCTCGLSKRYDDPSYDTSPPPVCARGSHFQELTESLCTANRFVTVVIVPREQHLSPRSSRLTRRTPTTSADAKPQRTHRFAMEPIERKRVLRSTTSFCLSKTQRLKPALRNSSWGSRLEVQLSVCGLFT